MAGLARQFSLSKVAPYNVLIKYIVWIVHENNSGLYKQLQAWARSGALGFNASCRLWLHPLGPICLPVCPPPTQTPHFSFHPTRLPPSPTPFASCPARAHIFGSGGTEMGDGRGLAFILAPAQPSPKLLQTCLLAPLGSSTAAPHKVRFGLRSERQ